MRVYPDKATIVVVVVVTSKAGKRLEADVGKGPGQFRSHPVPGRDKTGDQFIAEQIGQFGVTGIALWSAIALASYIIGLSYVARRESTGGIIAYWPCLLLIFPAVLAFFANAGDYRVPALGIIAVYSIWVIHCLRNIYWVSKPKIGQAVSHLLAGIVIIDLLALGFVSLTWTILLVVLFVAALLFQKFIPAT